MLKISIPADVPDKAKNEFESNYRKLTHNTGRLMLFAGDQKIEHLNKDFVGEGIAPDDASPVHFFNIASSAPIGAFASQLGLIARYGRDFPNIPYIIKINSKTNLVPTEQKDPIEKALVDVEDVVEFKQNSKLNILGVGYTFFLGSEYEADMLREAAQVVYKAHTHGLVAIIWAYIRGKAVKNERSPELIAGAAGVAASLGADFIKVNPPDAPDPFQALKQAVQAAGTSKVVCSGGESQPVEEFLITLYRQIHESGTFGNATGRNIHQKPLDEAIRFCKSIFAISVENKTVEEALNIYRTGH